MRAIVWHAREDVRLEEVPVPQPGPNQVVIEVARCGLCGSDRREYDVGPFMIPRHRHPLTGHVGPVILGHEAVGRVIACGTNVAEPPETGARVAVDPTWSCGRCAACHRGQRQLCASAGFSGISAHGGLASHMVAAADGLVPIPDHVGDDEAALAEPLAVAVHAMARATLQPGRPGGRSRFRPDRSCRGPHGSSPRSQRGRGYRAICHPPPNGDDDGLRRRHRPGRRRRAE